MADELPLFPLSNIAFPGGLLPLRIFETRYTDMVVRCLKNGGLFGVCLLRAGRESGGASEPFDVGVRVRIVDFDRLDDGFLGITVLGEERFRVVERWQQPDRLWMGRIEILAEAPPAPLPADLTQLGELAGALYDAAGDLFASQSPRPEDAAWVGGRLSELLPLDIGTRQTLLELSDPVERLRRLEPLIHIRRSLVD